MPYQGRHFNFFPGCQHFFNFFNATELLKNWKKQHFIFSNLTLFIVPFFLFSLFFSVFSFFFFFLFLWGGRPPAPSKYASVPCALSMMITKLSILLGLLDLSVAFDTVDHAILLDWLQHCYGISGHVLRWIESYLTGRSQFVRFNGETSGTTMVTSYVPQGSVLGPILFIAYSAEVWHRGAARLQRARLCR